VKKKDGKESRWWCDIKNITSKTLEKWFFDNVLWRAGKGESIQFWSNRWLRTRPWLKSGLEFTLIQK